MSHNCWCVISDAPGISRSMRKMAMTAPFSTTPPAATVGAAPPRRVGRSPYPGGLRCPSPTLAPVVAGGEGTIEVEDGFRVWYRRVGDGPASPLLVLHGG